MKRTKQLKNIRKRVSVIVVYEGQILGFRGQDPTSGKMYFCLPGGQIEDGETAIDAAIRETLEETGYHISVASDSGLTRRYDFEWNGEWYDCETLYLKGNLLNLPQKTVNDAPYHRGVEWVPVSKLEEVFNYHLDILEPVSELVFNSMTEPQE